MSAPLRQSARLARRGRASKLPFSVPTGMAALPKWTILTFTCPSCHAEVSPSLRSAPLCAHQCVPPAARPSRSIKRAHPCHICAETGLTPATSAPGLGSPLPHLRRDSVPRPPPAAAHAPLVRVTADRSGSDRRPVGGRIPLACRGPPHSHLHCGEVILAEPPGETPRGGSFVCLSACLFVCLFVCLLSATRAMRHTAWHGVCSAGRDAARRLPARLFVVWLQFESDPLACDLYCWQHIRACRPGTVAPRHICTGTGPTPATSAPGLGPPPPHLHRDWAHPCVPHHAGPPGAHRSHPTNRRASVGVGAAQPRSGADCVAV